MSFMRIRVGILRIALVNAAGLLPVLSCATPRVAAPGSSALTVAEVIGWLPVNSQTLIVAKGPIGNETGFMGPRNFSVLLGAQALGPVTTYKGGEAFNELGVSRVRFAVEGARAFRSPRGLGLAPYEGSHILVFDDTAGLAIDRFMTRLATSGGIVASVSGVPATRLEWKWEEDDWYALVVRLRPNVLLVATSENMLAETVGRSRGGASGHAFPPELPEWSGVDTTARAWAIRHYVREGAALDPTTPIAAQRRPANEPDTLAVGMAVHTIGDSALGLSVHYHSRNPVASVVARRFWGKTGLGSSLVIEPGPRNSVRLTGMVATSRGVGDIGLLLLAALGHAIYL